MKQSIPRILVVIASSLAFAAELRAAGPTAEDVGDLGSFGHNVLYMGAASGAVQLTTAACPAPSPTPDPRDQCFTLNPPPASTTFNAENICTIRLPKRATRTIIYPALNFFINYQLENTSGVFQPTAFFFYSATLTIESDVLLDPAIIDPQTGLPAAGRLQFQFGYNYRDDRSMQTGDRHRQRMTLVRVGNAGINKAALVAQGLSPSVVDDLFVGPMTIRMSISGGALYVTDASITGNMRLFGD